MRISGSLVGRGKLGELDEVSSETWRVLKCHRTQGSWQACLWRHCGARDTAFSGQRHQRQREICPHQSQVRTVLTLDRVCYGVILLYAVKMYYFHWLVIKLIWPIARHNKARLESQTENTKRKRGGVREKNQPPGKKDARGQVKPQSCSKI